MNNLKTVLGNALFVILPLLVGCGQATKTVDKRATSNKDSASKPRPMSKKPETSTRKPTVKIIDAPNQGIQPQAAIDDTGTIHLIYFKGKPAAGDVFYVRKGHEEKSFSKPLRVNSKPGSVIATGNVRGAHLALGKNHRPHVAWMGSGKTKSRETGNASPMLYTRLSDKGDRFEVERNIIQKAYGLDGGGSVAADDKGNVYVVWHAPEPGKKGEEHRKVWVAHSKDDGKTFSPERPAFDEETGACGCCGMRAYVGPQGSLHILYRSATRQINRDMYLLRSSSMGEKLEGIKLDNWPIAACPMSTMSFGGNEKNVVAAWETQGQVYYARIDPTTGKASEAIVAPGKRKNRKHPVVVSNARGDVLLAWTEGMGWNRGGTLAWQIYDKDDKPTAEKGQATGVPVWSLLTAVTIPRGDFLVVR